ncbi:putative 4-hydroxy-4-methyl-2-oxoglutarate aldolase 2 isoform X1 [Hibiscus syriacus]|uniref:putative 4-hydroxy-4-methyl-2-oxoglutarate aldolase 2 isoform X1 n=1 Tax=Hibiscus syriacus TaxID=106335 RepID=UPI001921DAD4|nr:putative 4-hydroxy-4-methyl-2-oxoglutarate aldolase 2 isoform X1 [Hibiscus syriacus]
MALVTTAEVCDANPQLIVGGELRALQPIFQIYGRRPVFSGPIVTLKVFEDNVLIREFLEEKGNGRVLVVDGGGSLRCAILGGNPVVQAQNNGWAGIVVNGCVRDVDEINGCDIGVRALHSHPMKANKKGIGEKHVPITIAGTRICDGEWLYADTDGILISRWSYRFDCHFVPKCHSTLVSYVMCFCHSVPELRFRTTDKDV